MHQHIREEVGFKRKKILGYDTQFFWSRGSPLIWHRDLFSKVLRLSDSRLLNHEMFMSRRLRVEVLFYQNGGAGTG